ncbi:S-formylglutathione hydrolase [Marinimicrobium locisalis]|uniref:S-formylglutathione hydrolase n=1 Tax=Marinimicrobium locisalis TaxID=546022 RepID=UPI003221F963
MTLEIQSNNKSFGGWHRQYTHESEVLNCTMRFAVFLPQAAEEGKVPALYWLSGLTCTDENFMQKAGAQRVANELGLAIVAPDTSPRGEQVPDAPDGAFDLGLGAGFYVNALQEPWEKHYHMYDYVFRELPQLIERELPINSERSIAGHSMGGHGALVMGLRHQDIYRSISAFSPICHPMDCPWGRKAFTEYLGDDEGLWREYDASEWLKEEGSKLPILVDQGEADNFLHEQLKPETLKAAAEASGAPLTLRMQPGYDHSYYFIATFIEDHLRFHAKHLK